MSQPTGTYSHERLGISFSYPVDWSIDASDPAFIQLSLGEDTFVRIQSRLPGPVTLDTVISQFVRDFSVVSGFREISRSPTNNSSAPGLLISVEWLAENTPFRGDFTLLVEGARVFSLGAIAPEESFDQHRADFELVMNSFKITLSPTKRLVGIGGEVEGILDDIGARVSRIRGLPSLTGLENRLLTRGELIARAKSELLDGETRREAELLKSLCVILDLCSESDDMLKLLLSLQAQGALGYYKSEEDSLTVVTDQAEPDLLSFLTYAHEYTHALQDRRFGLPLIGPEEKTFDSSRAVGALVEGDSKLVEYLFYDSMPPEQQTLLLDLLDRAVKRFSMSPEAARAPRIIIETFSWEQTNGFDFVFSLYLEGGFDAINEAFQDPPQSTEQVIHPEKYLAGEEPHAVNLPDLTTALGDDWHPRATGVLGELLTTIYLSTYLSERQSETAAQGWGGDRYAILTDDQGRTLIAMRFSWDTGEDANEFFRSYLEFVDVKSQGHWELAKTEDDVRLWVGEGISLHLSRQSTASLVVIGPDRATVEAALNGISNPTAGG